MLSVIFIAVLIGAVLVWRASCRTVERSQRLVIERFGRFFRCVGPGFHVMVPFIEQGRLIELNDHVRGWQGLSEREIQAQLLVDLYGDTATK